jgi:selT/selW/selH-like putative selenoprotein
VPLEITGEAEPGDSGCLEVSVNGRLIHSRLKGDGDVDNETKVKKIFDAIRAAK